ncbi:hypothetical protein COSO111634_10740 [Corallococcus soli]
MVADASSDVPHPADVPVSVDCSDEAVSDHSDAAPSCSGVAHAAWGSVVLASPAEAAHSGCSSMGGDSSDACAQAGVSAGDSTASEAHSGCNSMGADSSCNPTVAVASDGAPSADHSACASCAPSLQAEASVDCASARDSLAVASGTASSG